MRESTGMMKQMAPKMCDSANRIPPGHCKGKISRNLQSIFFTIRDSVTKLTNRDKEASFQSSDIPDW